MKPRLAPSRDERVDLAASGLLVLLGLIGFRSAFGGADYLVAGLGGILVGLVFGHVIAALRLPLLAAVAAVAAAFVVFGGPLALRSEGLQLVPTPSVASDLLDGLVHGWARLATTVAPTGSSGNLLVVPYVAGHLGAVLSVVAARRVGRDPLCVAPAFTVLSLSILVGTDKPASLVLQGGVFSAVAATWITLRQRRLAQRVAAPPSGRRAAGGVVLLVGSAFGGLIVGPGLPLADTNERFVLRDSTEPPLDPRAFASPLVGFRSLLDPLRRDDVLLRVEGMPPGAWLRWAVLDHYDGLVWAAAPPSAGAGRYQRVGNRVPTQVAGDRTQVVVRVEDLATVWLPIPGELESIEFLGPRAATLESSFRYSRRAIAAAAPVGLIQGDAYRVSAVVEPDRPSLPELAELLKDVPVDPDAPVATGVDVPPALGAVARQHTSGEAGAWAKAAALLGFLQQGFYSDGDIEGRTDPPGHYLLRLVQFVGAKGGLVGNAEQYAAAMALLLRNEGIPARVVMGFRPDPDGTVRAGSVDAWVEVAFQGIGWARLDPTPPRTQRPDPEPPPQEVAQDDQPETPPPTSIPPRPSIPDAETDDLEESAPDRPDQGSALDLLRAIVRVATRVLLPALVVAGPPVAIMLAKGRRRRRRRAHGTPAGRIAAGWQEMIDTARDVGMAVPSHHTRRELSRSLPRHLPEEFAARADAASFGEALPTAEQAERYWMQVDTLRRRSFSGLSRPRRLRARISPASLLTRRDVRPAVAVRGRPVDAESPSRTRETVGA